MEVFLKIRMVAQCALYEDTLQAEPAQGGGKVMRVRHFQRFHPPMIGLFQGRVQDLLTVAFAALEDPDLEKFRVEIGGG